VIDGVPARCGRDLHTEALAQPVGDLGEERQAVPADEQPHRRLDTRQRLIVGQILLVVSSSTPNNVPAVAWSRVRSAGASFAQPSSPAV